MNGFRPHVALFTLVTLVIGFPILMFATFALADQTGINKLKSAVTSEIDAGVDQYNNGCSTLNIGVVDGAKIVYTKAYGTNSNVNAFQYWASVSKVATTMIAMQLWEQGRINLDTPVWNYTLARFDYHTMIPDQYETPQPLTLRNLLTHTGGVTHTSNVRKPTMFFRDPYNYAGGWDANAAGASYQYATNGFGVIGDILWGLEADYPTMVSRYINAKIDVPSLRTRWDTTGDTNNNYYTPGAYVGSNIRDFARFSIGIMKNEFISQSTLDMLMVPAVYFVDAGVPGVRGMGFRVEDTGDMRALYHTGSNGSDKSHFYVRPVKKRSVSIYCKAATGFTFDNLYNLTKQVDTILATHDVDSTNNSCVNPADCTDTPAVFPTVSPVPTTTIEPTPTITGTEFPTPTPTDVIAPPTNTPAVPTVTPSPAPAGPLAWWKLDETGGTRADASGHGLSLTDGNTVLSQTGKFGKAGDFEYSNKEYLTSSNAAFNISGSLTLVGWMRMESNGKFMIMASKNNWGNNTRSYRFNLMDTNKLQFGISTDGTLTELVGPSVLAINTWYHVAAVFDSGAKTMTIYLNGNQEAARSVSFSTLFQTSAPFMLGSNMNVASRTQFFDGLLDEWRVYNRPLSQSEIQSLMATP